MIQSIQDNNVSDTEIKNQLDHWRTVATSGTFEEAMTALETIVAALDGGELSLEVSIESFEVGAALVSRCSGLLENARVRVSNLMTDDTQDDDIVESLTDPYE